VANGRPAVVKHTGLVPFVHLFPRQGVAETRVLTIRGSSLLPDDEYGLLESYCVEAGCHCRRVMINVAGRRRQDILASVSYAFDRDDEWPGPFLDPLNRQSAYADVILDLVAQVLADPGYVDRLQAHYYQVKGAVSDPSHPCHAQLARSRAAALPSLPRGPARKRTRRGR
jgi:hypothetical protein